METITQEQFNRLVIIYNSVIERRNAKLWPSFDDWISLGDAVEPVIERLRLKLEEDQSDEGTP